MSCSPIRRRAPALAALALAALAFAPVAGAQISQGSRPQFKFESPIVNGMGTSSLADLQGKLVWIEFWGTY